jgi:hypothetical protein
MLKEAPWSDLRHCPNIFQDRLMKTTQKLCPRSWVPLHNHDILYHVCPDLILMWTRFGMSRNLHLYAPVFVTPFLIAR